MERTREAEIDRQSKRDHGIQSKTEGGRQRHVNGENKIDKSIKTEVFKARERETNREGGTERYRDRGAPN